MTAPSFGFDPGAWVETVHADTPRPRERGQVVVDDGLPEVLVDYGDELVPVDRARLRFVNLLALEPHCTCGHPRTVHTLRRHPSLVFCDQTGCSCPSYVPAPEARP